MTPKEIRAARKAIAKERIVAEVQLRACKAKLDALQARCEHPKMTVTFDNGSYGGPAFASTYYDCPDCGYHKSTM